MKHPVEWMAAAGRLTDILFPPQCLLTGEAVDRHAALSPAAWARLDFLDDPQCKACGMPFDFDAGTGLICASCLEEGHERALIRKRGLDRVRSALRYDDDSGRMILSLKYGDRTDSVMSLARLMQRAGRELLADPAVILVPVPLHRRRLRMRRFNQAALLAQALGQLSERSVLIQGLVRKRHTGSQQGKSLTARARNVQGAFAVRSDAAEAFRGRPAVLIDDVLTTGATLQACARTLKRAGAAPVSGLVLARVVKTPASV